MEKTKVYVGLGSCGIAAGAQDIYDYLKESLDTDILDIEVTSCVGMCYAEPIVEVVQNDKRIRYGFVDKKFADEIISFLESGELPEKNIITDTSDGKEYLDRQVKIVLKNCGIINPESIDDYLAVDGYKALEKAVKEYEPSQIIDIMKESGLRGRGGAGFLTGQKWSFSCRSKGGKEVSGMQCR